MHKLISSILVTISFILSANNAFSQIDHSISICYNKEEIAKCTGSAYCTACKNCSGCGYCNSGGTCGVCSSTKSNNNNSLYQPKVYTSTISNPYDLPDDKTSEFYGKILTVSTLSLNLRNGLGIDYSIVMKLKEDQELIFLAEKEDWIKIQVKSSVKVGFVHKHYVSNP